MTVMEIKTIANTNLGKIAPFIRYFVDPSNKDSKQKNTLYMYSISTSTGNVRM